MKKFLLLTDLHYRLPWYQWLLHRGPDFDLVCLGGDLLDMLSGTPRTQQVREIVPLLKELAAKVPLAICSGNHDNPGRMVVHSGVTVPEWLKDLDSDPAGHRWPDPELGRADRDYRAVLVERRAEDRSLGARPDHPAAER
jgi:predicted MPP superfamily phosphohydrolase